MRDRSATIAAESLGCGGTCGPRVRRDRPRIFANFRPILPMRLGNHARGWRVTSRTRDPGIAPLLLVIAGTCGPRVAHDIRLLPSAVRGSRAVDRARRHAPRRDSLRRRFRARIRSRACRHALLHTCCVARAEAAATNVSRHSVHRPMPPSLLSDVAIRRQQVDHDPAGVAAAIRRRGGSRSRREVDLS